MMFNLLILIWNYTWIKLITEADSGVRFRGFRGVNFRSAISTCSILGFVINQ
jgi:hypothetical protein